HAHRRRTRRPSGQWLSAESVRFEVGPIQMEFAVGLRHEADAKGGIKAWVLTADAEAKTARTRTHRIAFTLTPKDAETGGGVEIGNVARGDTSRFRSEEHTSELQSQSNLV